MEAAAVSRWQPPTIMRSGHDDAKGAMAVESSWLIAALFPGVAMLAAAFLLLGFVSSSPDGELFAYGEFLAFASVSRGGNG